MVFRLSGASYWSLAYGVLVVLVLLDSCFLFSPAPNDGVIPVPGLVEAGRLPVLLYLSQGRPAAFLRTSLSTSPNELPSHRALPSDYLTRGSRALLLQEGRSAYPAGIPNRSHLRGDVHEDTRSRRVHLHARD